MGFYNYPAEPVLPGAVQVVAAAGAALTLPDVTVASAVDITLTAPCTITAPPAGRGGKVLNLTLRQDITGGRLVTWPASFKFAAGTPPVLSGAANAVDFLQMITTDGVTWLQVAFTKGLA